VVSTSQRINQINPSTTLPTTPGTGSRPQLASILREGRKTENIHLSSGVIWGIPVHDLRQELSRFLLRSFKPDIWRKEIKPMKLVRIAFAATLVTAAPVYAQRETEVGENLVNCIGPLTEITVKGEPLAMVPEINGGACVIARKNVQRMLPNFCRTVDGRRNCKFDGMFSVPNKNGSFTFVINRILPQRAENFTANCVKWAPECVNLTGQISELPYSGETFFVEHNGNRKVLVLELATPICVDADKENNGEENIRSLQLEILTHSPQFKPQWLKGAL
jgi:hypothetical protein